MPLDPKTHRADDRLRRPHRPEGEWLRCTRACIPDQAQWGLPHALEIHGTTVADHALTIELLANRAPVPVGDTHWRPSGSTLHGSGADGGLQVVRDAFLDEDGALVLVLWFRNATHEAIEIEISPRWGFGEGELADGGWAVRMGPPLDDLRSHIPAGGRGRLVFTAGFGPDRRTALGNMHRWHEEPNPHHVHRLAVEDWFSRNAPRFACDDPWLELLWLAGWNRRREGTADPRPITSTDIPRDAFSDGDPDRPRRNAPAWDRWIESTLVGVRRREQGLRFEPLEDAGGLGGWCIDGLALGERRIAVAWDEPSGDDRYDDGCQGFSVHVDGRLACTDERPRPVEIDLDPTTGRCEVR
ncbi:MAG: hypothetical protein ACKO5K_09890 [Armatimonadota bacterium]